MWVIRSFKVTGKLARRGVMKVIGRKRYRHRYIANPETSELMQGGMVTERMKE